jgi:hypothetical protein
MPIENFQIEQEPEVMPVDLMSPVNRENFIMNANVGDVVWVSLIMLSYGKGRSLKKYIKPFPATITRVNKQGYKSVQFDWSQSKSSGRGGYEFNSIVSTTEDGCKYLHDRKIIELAAREHFSVKQRLYKKLLVTPAPVDDVLVEALNWKDTLTEQEKVYIQKLIEMSR